MILTERWWPTGTPEHAARRNETQRESLHARTESGDSRKEGQHIPQISEETRHRYRLMSVEHN